MPRALAGTEEVRTVSEPCQDALDLYAWAIEHCTFRDTPLPVQYLRIAWVTQQRRGYDVDIFSENEWRGVLLVNKPDTLTTLPFGASLLFPTLGEARGFGFGPKECSDSENEQPYVVPLTPPHKWEPIDSPVASFDFGTGIETVEVRARCENCETEQRFEYERPASEANMPLWKYMDLRIAPPENAQIGACVLRHKPTMLRADEFEGFRRFVVYQLSCKRCDRELKRVRVGIPPESGLLSEVAAMERLTPKELGRCLGGNPSGPQEVIRGEWPR